MDTGARVALWRLRRLAYALGWAASGGLALAAFAAGFHVANVMPLEAEVLELRARVQQLETQARSTQDNAMEPQRPDTQLLAFYEALPDVRQAAAVVTRLHAHARAVGLALERGEYRPLPDRSDKIVRYQIVLPIKGSYPQVKNFLAGAMRDTPGLALDGVGFQRDNADASILEAQVRFTVFLKEGA